MSLTPAESSVWAALADDADGDFPFYPFAHLMVVTGLDRAAVRGACRSLVDKGLARYGRGLWTEDGCPAGSGYAAVLSPADEKEAGHG